MCLPAILVAAGLRVALMVETPRALLQPDSPDLLATARELVDDGRFLVKSKRTFLVPTLYSAACFVPGLPALTTIALGQHALGVASVVLAGLLCRLWLRSWKWAVIPVTLAVACNPSMLWYEHVLMAESVYLFTTLSLAAAATVFVLRPGGWSLSGLLLAIFFQAGARPEGKLFLPFGALLIVMVLFRQPGKLAIALAGFLAVAIPAHLMTRTSQSGLLLLVTLVHRAPDEIRSAPGLAEYLRPIRDEIREDWADGPAFPGAKMRQRVALAVEKWLKATGQSGDDSAKEQVNSTCLKVAMEIVRTDLAAMPELAFLRFRHVAYKTTGERFEVRRFQDEQREVLEQDYPDIRPISRHLFGEFHGHVGGAVDHVLAASPDRDLEWINRLEIGYQRFGEAWCFPGASYDGKERPGIPVYYAGVLLGMIFLVVFGGRLRPFHFVWGATLLGLWMVIVLTGSTKPRFQFVFTPFLPIYCAVLLDLVLAAGRFVTGGRFRSKYPVT